MPKVKAQSFEKTEYSNPKDNVYPKFQTIYQIAEDYVQSMPNMNCRVALEGNMLRVVHHCYEMHAPTRMSAIQDVAKQYLDEFVKILKKEYKSRGMGTLSLKEDKTKAGNTVQKVSLNERYYLVFWRLYEIE